MASSPAWSTEGAGHLGALLPTMRAKVVHGGVGSSGATVLLALLLPACERPAPAVRPEPPAQRERPATALRLPVVDAQAPPVDAADAGPAEVELVHALEAQLTVSSTVANRRILPEHLVDGRLETAWNSRTGDLAGAWIELDLRGAERVRELRLTAGFVGRPESPGTFTENPRVVAVRLERDGQLLREARLDPASRELQRVPVEAPGGVLRVVVTELLAGTNARYREVCVSELEAWGVPRLPLPPHRGVPTPRAVQDPLSVRCGPRHPCASLEMTGPSATLEDHCRRFRRGLQGDACDTPRGEREPCLCEPGEWRPMALAAGSGPLRAAAVLRTLTERAARVECSMAVRTPAGWYVSEPFADCDVPPDFDSGSGPIFDPRGLWALPAPGGARLEFQYDTGETYTPSGAPEDGPRPPTQHRAAVECEVRASGPPRCEHAL